MSKGDDSLARAIQERVRQQNKSIEQLLREDESAVRTHLGVPVNWLNKGKRAFSSMAGVVAPNGDEMRSYAKPPDKVCGTCKKFNVASGREAMIKQRIGERLVREQDWQLHHLGVPLDHMGMCDESGGTMITCSIANADNCDGYRKR